MTRLVLLAHGSDDPVWRATFERLRLRISGELGPQRVRLAYMQFSRPTLDDIADEASRQEVSELRVLPLFLSAGGHVRHDIPRQVERARLRHSGLAIEVLEPIGESPAFGNLVSTCARRSLEVRP